MRPTRARIAFRWAIAAAVALLGIGRQTPAALTDCIDATCRVSMDDGAVGSGCVFERSGGSVFVLTTAHVVGAKTVVYCEFCRQGHPSRPLTGRVVQVFQAADAAVVAIPESAFAGLLPAVVPVAPRNRAPKGGETVISVGCAKGAWPTAWRGHVVDHDQAGDLRFVPPPADGRSGSAIFDAQGACILALVRARDNQRGEGIAITAQTLYRAFGGTSSEQETQACQGGICLPPRYRTAPYAPPQGYDGWQAAPQHPVRPTLPATAPGSIAVDLTETNRKLDEITRLLKEGLGDKATTPPRSAGPLVPIPEEAAKRLEDAEKTAKEVKQQSGRLQDSLTGLQDVVQKLTGDVGTLPQRFESRLEKVKTEGAEGVGQIARSYARDFLAEKLGDGTLGLTAGKILGGALGLSGPLGIGLAMGLWFLSRRAGRKIRSGEPLAVERLATVLGNKLDDLRERLGARGRTENTAGAGP